MKITIEKVIIFLHFLLVASIGKAQTFTYTSNDNNSLSPDIWSSPDTWTISNPLGWTPSTPGNPTHGNLGGVEIYGYTLSDNDLTIDENAPVINIYDTLFVDGDFTIESNTTVNVFGLLIVKGDLTIPSGEVQFHNNGTVVTTGNVRVVDGEINNSSDFYVYGTTGVGNESPQSGDGEINGCRYWEACDPGSSMSSENDLQTNDPELYDFVSSGNVVLPVKLLFFDAATAKNKVNLLWATSEEENFDYFTVEKSIDGVSFEDVGTVYSEGSNTKLRRNYRLIDHKPYPGTSYYRLKATDFDGSVEYFKAIYTVFEPESISANIYPNPGSGQVLHIEFTSTEIKNTSFRLFNLSGALMYQGEITFPANTITFDSQLEKGIYLAVIQSDMESKTFKWRVE